MTATAHELEVLLALNLFGLRQKIVTLSWYPIEVELYFAASVPDDAWIEYAWDARWCNARVYRNGKDGPTAPMLPGWASGIEPAWEVVEAMAARGWYILLGSGPGGHTVQFRQVDMGDGKWIEPDAVDHADAPYAIAKAALIALGVEVP